MAPIVTLALHFGSVIPTKMAAIPVVAGLVVGAAAGASFMVGSSSTDASAEAAKPAIASAAPADAVAASPVASSRAEQPCEAQTWPYIEAKCMASADQKRKVRMVVAPRTGETPTEAQLSSDAARAANPGLVSGDTVLYQPQKPVQAAKPRGKRETRRERERRWNAQSYQVPSEYQGRAGRPVIVVRPLRLEAFR